jgi:8-oxo-dGTP pyrophosphatase MutT (NUDIX family)
MKTFLRIFFIRNYYRIINPFRKLYWFITRPETQGAKCLVEYDNKFLFVRLAYAHKKWTIPGGGIKKNESPEDAAKREIREETGVYLSRVMKIGEYKSEKEYKKDTVHCFYGVADNDTVSIDPLEVKESGWFPLDMLPEPRVSSVERIIDFYKNYCGRE